MMQIEKPDKQYIAEINAFLRKSMTSWVASKSEIEIGPSRLKKYTNSFILRTEIRTEDLYSAILVKIPRKPSHHSIFQAIQDERLRINSEEYFSRMCSVWEAFQQANDPCCSAIQHLAYLDEWNAVVMFEVNGKTLKDMLLFGSPKKSRFFLVYLKNAAHWFRIYCEKLGLLRMETLPMMDVEKQVDVKLTQLSGYLNAAKVRSALMELTANCGEVPIAYAHEDYKYANILICADGSACGFDFPRRNQVRKPVYADLALLATDPETRFCTSITHGFLLPQEFFESSRKSILEGYFEDTPYNEPVFDFYCVVAILDKWANNEKRLSTGLLRYPGMILLPWMRKYFLKLLEKYLQLNGAR